MSQKELIKTVDLIKTYRTDEIETLAVNKVNFSVFKGEFVAIMGPSGCGKSTLLNIIGMIDSPNNGQYFFNDIEVSAFNEKKRANLRKHNIGFIFQSFNLIDELTVYENVELPLIYQKISASLRKERTLKALDQMKMTHRRNHFPQQLSGGQQQRVAVARAIVADPKLILADEPTGNLDSEHGEEVMDILTELNDKGTTIAMVTHSPAFADYAQRVVHLFDGNIVTENMKEKFHV